MSDYSAYAQANPGTDYPVKDAALRAQLTLDTDKVDYAQPAYQFGYKRGSASGLTAAFFGGVILASAAITAIADGTVALTNNTTNYIERTVAGAVSANTVGFTAGRLPLFTALTAAGAITTVTDKRAHGMFGELQALGAATMSSTLGVAGDFAVNTTKFTVSAASGNTVVAGTLTITGQDVTTGAVTSLRLKSSRGVELNIGPAGGTAVNNLTIVGSATIKPLVIIAEGTDSNVDIRYATRGSGVHDFFTSSTIASGELATGARQVQITHTASATRYLTLTGSAGGAPEIGTSAGPLAIAPNGGTAPKVYFLSDGTYCYLTNSSTAAGPGIGIHNSGGWFVGLVGGNERWRTTAEGYFKASASGAYNNSTGSHHELRSNHNANNVVEITHPGSDPYGVRLYFNGASVDNNTNYFLRGQDSTTDRVFIYSDGDIYNHDGTYGTISGRKWKSGITAARSGYLADIRRIGMYAYEKGGKRMLGPIADDARGVSRGLAVRDVFPGLTPDIRWGKGTTTVGLKESVLYGPVLMCAVQELAEKQEADDLYARGELHALREWRAKAEKALASKGITIH